MMRVVLLSLLIATRSFAQEETHVFSAYALTGASLLVTGERTLGGLAEGIGARDVIQDRFLVQADVSYLFLVGNAAQVRIAAGIQRRGEWTPALLVSAALLTGDELSFSTRNQALPTGPALTVGLIVAPLRFQLARAEVSFLEPSVGISTDRPFPSFHFQLTLMTLAVRL